MLNHVYYIALVGEDADTGKEVNKGTWPFGDKLREFILSPGDSLFVRDETGTDVMVIARG